MQDFTDEEMDMITVLASPVPPSLRVGFLQVVANRIAGYPPQARGPGLLYRIAVEAQHELLKAGPVAVGAGKQISSPRRAASTPSLSTLTLKRP